MIFILELLYKLDVIISLKIMIQTGEGRIYRKLTGLQEDVPNCGVITPTRTHMGHSS